MELLAVGLGCALGAVCRYLLETGLNGWLADPLSILIINCCGCFLMGLFTTASVDSHQRIRRLPPR